MIRPAGPVLEAGELARVIVEVLRDSHPGLEVVDRGSYLRVQAPGVCRLEREAVEERLGATFHLPGDLERIMPSFSGRLTMDEETAVWRNG